MRSLFLVSSHRIIDLENFAEERARKSKKSQELKENERKSGSLMILFQPKTKISDYQLFDKWQNNDTKTKQK